MANDYLKGTSDTKQCKIKFHKHSGEKPFSCSECNKSFPRKYNLEQHIKNCHVQKRVKPPKSKICPVCNKEFSRSIYLKEHSRIHNDVKPYKCNYCSKEFRFSGNYYRHVEGHEEELGCNSTKETTLATDLQNRSIGTS